MHTTAVGRMKLFLALAALAAPAMGAHHPLPAYVNGWRQGVAAVRDDAQVTVTLVVKEQGAEAIRRVALAVSDPASKSYGEFLTTQQVAALTAPKSDDMNTVTSWLESNGVGFQVRHSNVVASMSVADASKLFSTKFHLATHTDQPKPLLRAAAFALPEEVEASVATVFGLHGLPLPRRQAVVVTSQDGQPAKVTPEVLNSFYGISGVKPTRSDKNKQAVAEFQGQFMVRPVRFAIRAPGPRDSRAPSWTLSCLAPCPGAPLSPRSVCGRAPLLSPRCAARVNAPPVISAELHGPRDAVQDLRQDVRGGHGRRGLQVGGQARGEQRRRGGRA